MQAPSEPLQRTGQDRGVSNSSALEGNERVAAPVRPEEVKPCQAPSKRSRLPQQPTPEDALLEDRRGLRPPPG